MGWNWSLTRVNIKIKIVIIIVFKSNLELNPKQDLGHGLRGSTCVDPSQHVDKIYYYNSFKTLFRSWSGTRPKLQVGRFNISWPKLKKSKQPRFEKKNNEWIFTRVLSWGFFDRVRSDQFFFYFIKTGLVLVTC
jgi:hypothetical protein